MLYHLSFYGKKYLIRWHNIFIIPKLESVNSTYIKTETGLIKH